jgi:hypothetical protein
LSRKLARYKVVQVFFVIVIYAIIGLELFKGKLHATCYKLGTQTYVNVSDLYGPEAPLVLKDPGDYSVDEDGSPFPCDPKIKQGRDSRWQYQPSSSSNYSNDDNHGRVCLENELCLGPAGRALFVLHSVLDSACPNRTRVCLQAVLTIYEVYTPLAYTNVVSWAIYIRAHLRVIGTYFSRPKYCAFR